MPPTPITLERIERVLQPIARATGLPNEAYLNEAHFEHERAHVIGRTWAALAFADAVPATQAWAQPIDFMGWPLLLTRDAGGTLRVFHNVCSHRGMRLVQHGTAVQGLIRCPYHSWTYQADGQLKGTPHIGGINEHQCAGFERAQHGLKAVRSATWMGIVFINLSGDAPPFDEHIAPLRRRIETLIGDDGWRQLATGVTGGKLALDVACNWKLAVENYCEAYHLPWVHPALNSYSRLEDHYCFTDEQDFAGQGSTAYRLSDIAGTKLPRLERWPSDKLRRAEYPALYPNVLLGFQADHAYAVILTPLAADRTREEMRIWYVGDGAVADAYLASRNATQDAWRVVFTEDVFAVEGMQLGRVSPGYGGGVFAPEMDRPTHHFHSWVARKLAAAAAAPARA